jgi:hypothetical protein
MKIISLYYYYFIYEKKRMSTKLQQKQIKLLKNELEKKSKELKDAQNKIAALELKLSKHLNVNREVKLKFQKWQNNYEKLKETKTIKVSFIF